jgi:uncharacterized protein (TIGR02246 family)
MKIKTVLIIPIIFFCFSAFPQQGKISGTQEGTIKSENEKQAIMNLWAEWRQAIKTADIDKLITLATEDAEFWANKAKPLTGRDSLKEVFRQFFEKFKSDQEFKCIELIIADGWAFARGMEINRLTPVGGGEPVIHKQRGFSLMRKGSDGKWRFARGMTNLPPEN